MTVLTPRILAITGAIAIGSAVPAAAQQSPSSGDRASQRAMENQSEQATKGQSGAQQVSQQELERYVRALMGLASFDPDFAVVARRGQTAEITLVDRGLTSAEARQALQQAGISAQEFRRITAAIHQDEAIQQRYRQLVQQQVAQARQQQAGQQQMGQGYGAPGAQGGGRAGTAELRPIGRPPGGGGGMTSGQQMQGQQMRQSASAGRLSDEQLQRYVEARRGIEQQIGWDEFVRIHNQVVRDRALQSRVQQMRGQSGPQSSGGQTQSGTNGQSGASGQQQTSPGQGAPLPSGGALGVGPGSAAPGEQQPPGTQAPGLGPNIPTPTQ
jgi:hypothetical protein